MLEGEGVRADDEVLGREGEAGRSERPADAAEVGLGADQLEVHIAHGVVAPRIVLERDGRAAVDPERRFDEIWIRVELAVPVAAGVAAHVEVGDALEALELVLDGPGVAGRAQHLDGQEDRALGDHARVDDRHVRRRSLVRLGALVGRRALVRGGTIVRRRVVGVLVRGGAFIRGRPLIGYGPLVCGGGRGDLWRRCVRRGGSIDRCPCDLGVCPRGRSGLRRAAGDVAGARHRGA